MIADECDMNARAIYIYCSGGDPADGIAVVATAPGPSMLRDMRKLCREHRMSFDDMVRYTFIDMFGFTALPGGVQHGTELLFDPATIRALQLTGGRTRAWPSDRYGPVPIKLHTGWQADYTCPVGRGRYLTVRHPLSPHPGNVFYQGTLTGAEQEWVDAARRLRTVTLVAGKILSRVPGSPPDDQDLLRAARNGDAAALRIPVRIMD